MRGMINLIESVYQIMKDRIKDTIQDCNINFLIGSGLSSPYLKPLGNIEILLTKLEEQEISDVEKKVIRASLYKKFFEDAIFKNSKILEPDIDVEVVLKHYHNFLKSVNSILLRRKSTILSKEVNLFTTNFDIFLEKALEDTALEFNDGFNGRFLPQFNLTNFKKSRFKKSLHYDNISEIPVFNLLKLHGSLSWELIDRSGNYEIVFSCDLKHLANIQGKLPSAEYLIDVQADSTIETLVAAVAGKTLDQSVKVFMEAYEKLPIVNPNKDKFRHTLLNQTYYEMLRIYSNELEKENTILFVMGFSFADEHIREITLRAANSNPTMMIYIFAYSSKGRAEIQARFDSKNIKNNNVLVIGPEMKDDGGDKFKYDLETINSQIFDCLLDKDDSKETPPDAPNASA